MFKTFQEVLAVSDQVKQTLETIRKGNSPRGETYCSIGIPDPYHDGYNGENAILVRHWCENGQHPLAIKHNNEYMIYVSIEFIFREMLAPMQGFPTMAMTNPIPGQGNLLNQPAILNGGRVSPAGIMLFTSGYQVRKHIPTDRIIHDLKRKMISSTLERVTSPHDWDNGDQPSRLIRAISARWFNELQDENHILISAMNEAGEIITQFEHKRENTIPQIDRDEITAMFATNAFVAGLIANQSDHQTEITKLVFNQSGE